MFALAGTNNAPLSTSSSTNAVHRPQLVWAISMPMPMSHVPLFLSLIVLCTEYYVPCTKRYYYASATAQPMATFRASVSTISPKSAVPVLLPSLCNLFFLIPSPAAILQVPPTIPIVCFRHFLVCRVDIIFFGT
ncbi:hypothetical protein TWF970_005323 [Orbilia oligospora]|uniref:Uncharacterized protein n=1 Tax=Orbilia oligospora TaxID=2813651 RepID=A0A7C8VPW4_ORBOL|nr:hypothetical protein TWF970_005323 [Orbilia oligospora]